MTNESNLKNLSRGLNLSLGSTADFSRRSIKTGFGGRGLNSLNSDTGPRPNLMNYYRRFKFESGIENKIFNRI